MAQSTGFDPVTKAQDAVEQSGSIFAIIFGGFIVIVLGMMVIKYIKRW
jgi:hypothetical protein